MKILRFLIFSTCTVLSIAAWAQEVSVKPSQPQIGDEVTIQYQNASSANPPELVFSYSNFFEMASRAPMNKGANGWELKFKVPRYAKFATFYIQDGAKQVKPSQGHYELTFYKGDQPVFDTYLYKAYSLAAQYGRADSVKALVKQLTYENYNKELALYPANYPAKLRLLVAKMEDDKANAAKYKAEGLRLIEAKLAENPTKMANINQVTMGYLIMNEGNRIDSLKTFLLKKYPNTEIGFEYRYEDAYKTKDEEERFKKMKQLLDYKTDGENSSLSGVHEHLFAYYAKRKDEKNALKSARFVAAVKNPWQPQEIKNIATVLAANDLALDSALYYAEVALDMVYDYPFGTVRYFPEYGYIPGYVDKKDILVMQQKGDILALIGYINTKLKRNEIAAEKIRTALELTASKEANFYAAYYYEQMKQPEKAFEAYRNILLLLPTDSAAMAGFKKSYISYKGSGDGFETAKAAMIGDWEKLTLPKMAKTKLNQPAPLFSEVYDMNGKLVDPAVLKGKTIVIDFWATWCVPCIEGFPYMQQVYNRFKDNKDIVFMITNSGSKNSLQDAQEWVKKNGYTFPFYYNDRKLAAAFNITTIPTTFIIDGNGNVQYKTVGFEGPIMEPKLGLQIKSVANLK